MHLIFSTEHKTGLSHLLLSKIAIFRLIVAIRVVNNNVILMADSIH